MTGDRYERLPMVEWVFSEEGYNIGKELFRGTNMVHESSAMFEPLMAAGNFTEVINDWSFSGNHKAQFLWMSRFIGILWLRVL